MKTKVRVCDFCKSEEGLPRPIGNYLVKLKNVNIYGIEKKVCQNCYPKSLRIMNKQTEEDTMKQETLMQKVRKVGFKFFGVIFVIMLTTIAVNSQGLPGLPPLPDDPDPAPIDGGLGLLAAAGGAYAYKKLRDKNKEDDLE